MLSQLDHVLLDKTTFCVYASLRRLGLKHRNTFFEVLVRLLVVDRFNLIEVDFVQQMCQVADGGRMLSSLVGLGF